MAKKTDTAAPAASPEADIPRQGVDEKNFQPDPAAIEEQAARRIAADNAELERLRTVTPAQRVKIRPDAKAAHLGLIVRDSLNGKILRLARLVDWRTELLTLEAGHAAHVVVLVGPDGAFFDSLEAAHAAAAATGPGEVRESVAQDNLEG